MKKQIITSIGLLTLTSSLWAQEIGETPKNLSYPSYSIEIDPAVFAMNGYGVHIRYAFTKNILAGIGAYALDMPSIMVDMNSKNKDEGWKVRIDQGLGLFGEYHFNQIHHGFFGGIQTSTQKFIVKQNNEKTEYLNLLIMPYAGYTWSPFENGFYIKPWAGIGYTTTIDGNSKTTNHKFDVAPYVPFATLHLGYAF